MQTAGNDLRNQLAAVGLDALAEAVDRELRARAGLFLAGIERYRHYPYRRSLIDPPSVWDDGTTRLLDYGRADRRSDGGIPVLVVPSLINRSYVLDLSEERSLLRMLAARGLRPFLVDWGKPGEVERRFTLTDYIAGRLESALDAVEELTGRPVAVMGYCMGGLLALALALRRPRQITALALLATPWDFHAENPGQARLLGALARPFAASFGALGELPVDLLQSLFAGLDPLLALRKFTRFAGLDEAGPKAREFVALEDWLNDGVPLPLAVGEEGLADWYGANLTARGAWRVAGRLVDPSRCKIPALVITPAQDRIVPQASARALAGQLPDAKLLTPSLGHIGMIVSQGAPDKVWLPLADWLLAQAEANSNLAATARMRAAGKRTPRRRVDRSKRQSGA